MPGRQTTVGRKGSSVTTYTPPKNTSQQTSIRQSSTKWGMLDFISHYFNGNGQAVTLRQIGLAKDFENSSSVANSVKNYIENVFILGSFDKTTTSDVTLESLGLFSIGDSSLSMTSSCGSSICNFNFSIRDRFKDPADIFDILPGEFELPGGKEYQINHDWGGSIKIPQQYLPFKP